MMEQSVSKPAFLTKLTEAQIRTIPGTTQSTDLSPCQQEIATLDANWWEATEGEERSSIPEPSNESTYQKLVRAL